jgi:hypothetical protein
VSTKEHGKIDAYLQGSRGDSIGICNKDSQTRADPIRMQNNKD